MDAGAFLSDDNVWARPESIGTTSVQSVFELASQMFETGLQEPLPSWPPKELIAMPFGELIAVWLHASFEALCCDCQSTSIISTVSPIALHRLLDGS